METEKPSWTPEEESAMASIEETTGCPRNKAKKILLDNIKAGLPLATVGNKKTPVKQEVAKAVFKLTSEENKTIRKFIEVGGKWRKNTADLLELSVEVDAIFDRKPRGVEIAGCTNQEDFYRRYVGISLRRIQQLKDAARDEPNDPEPLPIPVAGQQPLLENNQQQAVNEPTDESTEPHHLTCEHGIELSSAQSGGCPHCAEDRERDEEERHRAKEAHMQAAAPRLAPPAPPTPSFAISPADIAANDLDTNVETAVNWIMSYKKFMSGNLWNEFLTRVVEELNGRASVPDKNKGEQCDYSEDEVAAMFAGGK